MRITSVDGLSVVAFQGGLPNFPDQVTPFAAMAQSYTCFHRSARPFPTSNRCRPRVSADKLVEEDCLATVEECFGNSLEKYKSHDRVLRKTRQLFPNGTEDLQRSGRDAEALPFCSLHQALEGATEGHTVNDTGRAATGMVLLPVGIAQFLTPFMLTAVGVALPSLGSELHASAAQLGLVEQLYALSLAMTMLTFGRLGDISLPKDLLPGRQGSSS